MIRFNKHALTAMLLIASASVRAEKDNDCLNIMSWVNGKFRMFSTECSDEVLDKVHKTKVEYKNYNVRYGNGWNFFNWKSTNGNNITISNGTVFGKEIESSITNSVVNYNDGSVSSVNSTPSTVTISHSDCRYGCINGTGRDSVKKKNYILSRKKRNFDIEQYGSIYTLECDKVVQDARNDGLILGVDNNGRVQYGAPQNTSMKFSRTNGELLCKVLAMKFRN